MNARNFLYVRKYNPANAKKIGDNKLRTKRILIKEGIATTEIIKAFGNREAIRNFDWKLPREGFAVKPARGYGGEGIIVFTSWNGIAGTTLSGEIINAGQLESHLFDIFEGEYSLQNLPDKAYVEERINPNKFFRKLTSIGLPDIRVILFNKIPVMAMLRLPTRESGGTANLHRGALAVAVDIRTGITKDAYGHGKFYDRIPGTNVKARGIKVPEWDTVLKLSAQAQEAIGLGFAGIDIVFDAVKGPLVLEVNARPGLEIQRVNKASLRNRLERVEDIKVSSVERGVALGKSLFADFDFDAVETDARTLAVIEPVTFINHDEKRVYEAKIDSGAYRTSVDWSVVREMKLEVQKQKIFIKSASGKQYRPAVKIQFVLAGKRVKTIATVADRKELLYPMIIGRRDIKGFLIDPSKNTPPEDDDSEG